MKERLEAEERGVAEQKARDERVMRMKEQQQAGRVAAEECRRVCRWIGCGRRVRGGRVSGRRSHRWTIRGGRVHCWRVHVMPSFEMPW